MTNTTPTPKWSCWGLCYLQNQQDASPSIAITTQKKVVLPVSVWQVCVLLPEAAADPGAPQLRKKMSVETFPGKSYSSTPMNFQLLIHIMNRQPKIQDCEIYLIFKVCGDDSDTDIHYAYIKCAFLRRIPSLWQPYTVWEETSATCRFPCTNICLFLHGEHFLMLFPVFQLLCSALQASHLSLWSVLSLPLLGTSENFFGPIPLLFQLLV